MIKIAWAMKPKGSLQFNDASPEVQDDVVAVISGDPESSNEDALEVREILSNGATLPLVSLQPKSMVSVLSRRGMSRTVVEKYSQAWKNGADFPPIVIDSRKKIIEGGHRAAGAILAGIPRIMAINVAGARIVETEDPYARGHFYSTFVF